MSHDVLVTTSPDTQQRVMQKIWTKLIIAINGHNLDILTLVMKQTCSLDNFEHIAINGMYYMR